MEVILSVAVVVNLMEEVVEDSFLLEVEAVLTEVEVVLMEVVARN